MSKKVLSMAGAAILVFNSVNASADYLASAAFAGTNTIYGNTTSWTNLNISGSAASGGAIALVPFITTVNNQPVTVMFTGECAMDYANPGQFIALRFRVDSSLIMGPSDYRAFCTSHGTDVGISDDVGTAIAHVVVPTAGTHNLYISARMTDGSGNVTNAIGYTRKSMLVIQK